MGNLRHKLWVRRSYAAAFEFAASADTSLTCTFLDMGKRINWKQDGLILFIEGLPNAMAMAICSSLCGPYMKNRLLIVCVLYICLHCDDILIFTLVLLDST